VSFQYENTVDSELIITFNYLVATLNATKGKKALKKLCDSIQQLGFFRNANKIRDFFGTNAQISGLFGYCIMKTENSKFFGIARNRENFAQHMEG